MRNSLIIILFSFSFILFIGCNKSEPQEYYREGHAFFTNGEYAEAVQSYLQCVNFKHNIDCAATAYAYRDMAVICHLEGNHRMAYEINEISKNYFNNAHLSFDYYNALYLSAVYKAYAGHTDEAVSLLRYARALSADTVVQNKANLCLLILQENHVPILCDTQIQDDPVTLYAAVELIQYELFKRPQRNRFIIMFLSLFIVSLGVYIANTGVLKHLKKIQSEKKVNMQVHTQISQIRDEYQHQYEADIHQFCNFLRVHPEEIKKELCWTNYEKMRSVVNLRLGNIVSKVEHQTSLNETEVRLCVLVMLGLQRNQVAEILPYAVNSVGKLKNTVSKKLGTDGKNLRHVLENWALNIAQ